tara:strand:+ start:143 stop:316 length:174 start_codon:yes stop_codon:yes gene_type:complete
MLHWMAQTRTKVKRGRAGASGEFLQACTAVEFGCDSFGTLNVSDFVEPFEELVIEGP